MIVLYCRKSFSCLVYKNLGYQFIATEPHGNLFLKMMETLPLFHFYFGGKYGNVKGTNIRPGGELRKHKIVYVDHGNGSAISN